MHGVILSSKSMTCMKWYPDTTETQLINRGVDFGQERRPKITSYCNPQLLSLEEYIGKKYQSATLIWSFNSYYFQMKSKNKSYRKVLADV